MPEVGFEPTHPKITELKSAALDHSAIQALIIITLITTAGGFEPPRVTTHQISNQAPEPLGHAVIIIYSIRIKFSAHNSHNNILYSTLMRTDLGSKLAKKKIAILGMAARVTIHWALMGDPCGIGSRDA